LFSYKELKIVSAVPIAQITAYLCELGAVEAPGSGPENVTNVRRYTCAGLEIEITANKDDAFPDIGIPRHTIMVFGDKTLAEDFLTTFRLRFMSAGG